jgi:uncharacterized Zn-binding protein involved in type VI secretion
MKVKADWIQVMAKVVTTNIHVNGTCTAHANPTAFTGTFTVGSPTVTSSGYPVVRINDTGTTSCGHHIKATTGSTIVKADGIGVHRVGDTGIVIEGGTYTVTTGDPVTDAL